MKVVLIRHGQTEGNALGQYIGSTDQPLSKAGEALAREKGSCSSVKKVIVTPMLRTRQTAAILFPKALQKTVEGLREMDFGAFEQRSAKDMEGDGDYRYWVEETRCMGLCPGGESAVAFQKRAAAAFYEEVRQGIQNNEERLVFVIHGGVIMAVLSAFGEPQAPFYSWMTENCQGYACSASLEEGKLILRQMKKIQDIKNENDF